MVKNKKKKKKWVFWNEEYGEIFKGGKKEFWLMYLSDSTFYDILFLS